VQRALEHEVTRQAKALAAGERIVQETRLWEADRGYTRSMRSKEYAHDYRYFPEPDLVPLQVDAAWVDPLRAGLPELPRARRQRFVTDYQLPAYDAEVLTQSRALAEYFEATVSALVGSSAGRALAGADAGLAKTASNWIMSELLREVPADDEQALRASPVPPASLAGLVRLIEDGTISGKIAKDVFQRMVRTGDDARTIVEREGLTQVADEGALASVVEAVIAQNPRAVEDYRKGKTAAAKALVGQVMRATGGKANPAVANRLVEDRLRSV
jgi:aspartyl-tRNA(Asn)/glutamyl-tRNA(Gln) amidotransferase subunit B